MEMKREFTLRRAAVEDLPVLQALVADSVWVLQAKDYNDA